MLNKTSGISRDGFQDAAGASRAWLFPNSTSAKATIATLLVAVLLPSAVYYYVAERFGLLGPRINIDLLLLAIVAILVARRFAPLAAPLIALGIGAILGIQIGIGVGTVYIDDPALIREYIGFVQFWPWRVISLWMALGVAALVAICLVMRKVDIARASMAPFVAMLLVLTGLDLAGRTAVGYTYLGDNIATSSAVRLGKLMHQWSTTPGFSASPIEQPMMVRELQGTDARRLISISVESFGLAHDAHFNEAVLAPMRGILAQQFTVEAGQHPSKGGTLSGELRELCNARTGGTPTAEATRALRDGCLPALLGARGYETLGMHGNSGFFYNRQSVYPGLGFQKTLFYEDMIRGAHPAARCKTRAFEGVCDRAMVAQAIGFVADAEDAPRYAHLMTLDTHFPLGTSERADDRCGLISGLKDTELCLYANAMATVLTDIAQQLAAAPVPPDEVVIFGDHAPPYVVATQRNFFDREATPYIVIRKR